MFFVPSPACEDLKGKLGYCVLHCLDAHEMLEDRDTLTVANSVGYTTPALECGHLAGVLW